MLKNEMMTQNGSKYLQELGLKSHSLHTFQKGFQLRIYKYPLQPIMRIVM